jgi:hypothetical protein
MTVLLDSQMSNITIDQRSEPYYKQYHHCVIWWMPEGNMMRQLTHKSIDANIFWRNNYLQNWRGSFGRTTITERDQERLHEVCDMLLTIKNPFKKVVCNNTMWFYTNHPEDFAAVVACPGTKLIEHKQANISLPADCIMLNTPKHKFRTFFRERFLDDTQRELIKKYFNTRTGQFRAGPGFKQLLNGSRQWIASYYFVDHDDEKDALFINIACPQLVRKTLPIRARN